MIGLRAPVVLLCAITLLASVACGDLGFDLKPGSITVTNTSATDSAVIAILADDAKSYPTLGPGSSVTVKTNIGGRYTVTVVYEKENLAGYLDSLKSLRTTVEKIIDGSSTTDEKVTFFSQLAGIKAAISQIEQAGAVGCQGRIELDSESESSVTATIKSTTVNGTPFWDVTCGSS